MSLPDLECPKTLGDKIPHITYMNKMVLLFCYDHIAVRPKIPSVLSIFYVD